jgi:hypothetical protein
VPFCIVCLLSSVQISVEDATTPRPDCRYALRHNADFGKESEAIVSTRQHRPAGQNLIVLPTNLTNTAQAWLHDALASATERQHAQPSGSELK